jgi:hypothetical protein
MLLPLTARSRKVSGARGSAAKEPSANAAPVVAYAKDSPGDIPLQNALLFVFGKRSYRCFLCVGKARSLGDDDPRFAALVHEFYSPEDLHDIRHRLVFFNGLARTFSTLTCDSTGYANLCEISGA